MLDRKLGIQSKKSRENPERFGMGRIMFGGRGSSYVLK
jgi:hypothetical protein